MRRIRVMADYDCWPLWKDGPDTGNIDPATLSISGELRRGLDEWQRRYDATFQIGDPSRSSFDTPEVEAQHHADGRELAESLRAELGEGVMVRYWLDEPAD